MTTPVTLTLAGDIDIVLPDTLDVISSYVLREQGDWFEDEIKFLRRLLQRDEKVVDIGANYGVYTLSMARSIGPGGKVWAFEPTASTASFLAASITANAFDHITLVQSALSSHSGSAQLALGVSPELNSLVRDQAGGGETETVRLTTLDACMNEYDWPDIGFLKIDAEGEEENILLGGARFLAKQSPLIQYEVKDADAIHTSLIQVFSGLGYDTYRLVPGLDLLVPFDEHEPVKPYLLNLFACKPDRAANLATRGFLVSQTELVETAADAVYQQAVSANGVDLLALLGKYPYGETCTGLWRKTAETKRNEEIETALLLYLHSRDKAATSAERFVALRESFYRLKKICAANPAGLRLSSLARAARDYGARGIAVDGLARLCATLLEQRRSDPGEPFLAPGPRFDVLPCGKAVTNWITAAALEEYQRCASYSSFYQGEHDLQQLKYIRALGFGSAEMARRLDLLQQRIGTTGS